MKGQQSANLFDVISVFVDYSSHVNRNQPFSSVLITADSLAVVFYNKVVSRLACEVTEISGE